MHVLAVEQRRDFGKRLFAAFRVIGAVGLECAIHRVSVLGNFRGGNVQRLGHGPWGRLADVLFSRASTRISILSMSLAHGPAWLGAVTSTRPVRAIAPIFPEIAAGLECKNEYKNCVHAAELTKWLLANKP